MKIGQLSNLMSELNVGLTFATALKRAAGLKSRKFDIDRVVRWYRKHPEFQIADVYQKSAPDGSLFIPLRAEFFDAFKAGRKQTEYRTYGPRWNERTCRVGRAVTLSCGYRKAGRLKGRVTSFSVNSDPGQLDGWASVYGNRAGQAACIGIELCT